MLQLILEKIKYICLDNQLKVETISGGHYCISLLPDLVYDNSEEVLMADVSFDKAKEQEIESWTKNGVYSVVKDEGEKTISTNWVYLLKSTPNGIMQKA